MIHPTAFVSPTAELGSNTEVGAFSIVHSGVILGPNSIIGSHCEIGLPSSPSELSVEARLRIGSNALIRSHSIIYAGSTIGERFTTGHRVTVRESMSIGDDCQVGTLSDIQGNCSIGNGVRLHSNVHVSQHTSLRDYVWMFPFSITTNDPIPPSDVRLGCTVESFAVVAVGAILLPGIRVGRGALVGAGSVVSRNVDPNALVLGNPAVAIGTVDMVKLRDGSGNSAYPWALRFRREFLSSASSDWLSGAT